MKREVLKEKWTILVDQLSEKFADGEPLDLDGMLFLVGVQELGLGYQKFKKDEKLNLMHIAICRVLEPYGYYRYDGRDEDGWPHYELIENLPPLKAGEQSYLMKEAVVRYFDDQEVNSREFQGPLS